MSEAGAPHDVAELLERLMREKANASICADDDNVSDLVWLGDAALRELDDHAERLAASAAARRKRSRKFDHAAYVQVDGSLVVVGQTRHGAFIFTVTSGGWGWTRPLM